MLFCKAPCLAADFRDAEWGMSKDQVKSLEKTEPIYHINDTLTFKGKILNSQVHIIYKFVDNQLRTGMYTFVASKVNNNVYLRDYDRVNESLDLKYGKPETRKEIWGNELYKEKTGFYGLAVSMGHLRLESSWSEERTIVLHKLSGVNNIIDHSISYFDKNYFDKNTFSVEKYEMKGL
jgi:hypothetical protein